jgi:hypothetical protein
MPREELQTDIDIMEHELAHIGNTDIRVASKNDLVDLYVLSSELEGSSDDFRKEVRDQLQDRMDGKRVEGTFGRVTRVDATSWSMKDDDFVVNQMRELGVSEDELMSVDSDKVEAAIEEMPGVEKEDFFDSYEYSYLQKTGVDQENKLEMIQDRCGGIDDEATREACIADFMGDD